MADSAILKVKVVPGASRNRVAGLLGDALKVQVSAAPEAGKANSAVIALLAETFDLNPKQFELTAGPTSPRKTFRIVGMTQSALDDHLAQWK